MKILAVKLKNINTLVGEWEIRFDQPPLSDTGLFAIVGPNGSGKSSILDALTLALYGETARLRSPESGVTGLPVDDSSSEVTFSVGDAHYRSRWSIRKSGGVWEAPEMWLVGVNNGDETLLEDRLIRVRSRMAELTGLDFKRFCRSVLLAQGDFAAFLNALENERAEILEKIIGSEMAQELEESVGNRARDEHEKLLQLKESAASYPVPDRARISELQQSHEQTEEEYKEAGDSLAEQQEIRARIEQRERLEAEGLEVAASLAAAEARWAEVRLEAQKLEEAWPASPLREKLELLDSLSTARDTAQERLLVLELEIPEKEARLGELEAGLRQNRKDWEEARSRMEDRSSELMDASACDREIESESQRFLDTVSRYEAVERDLKETLRQQSQVKERLDQIESRRSDILRWLERHRVEESLGTDVAVLEGELKRLADIGSQVSQFRTQRSEAQKLEGETARELERAERAVHKAQGKADRLNQRRSEREARLDELLEHTSFDAVAALVQEQKKKLTVCRELIEIAQRAQGLGLAADAPMELARIEAEQDILKQSLAKEKAGLEELEGRIRYRDLVRRLGADRPSLALGEPCPLCGALDHPFVEREMPDFTELDRTVEERTRRIDALQKELDGLQSESDAYRAQAGEVELLRNRWDEVCARAGLDWAMTDADTVQNQGRSMEEDIKRRTSNLRKAKWWKWRISWAERSLQRKNEKLRRREREQDEVRKRHEARKQAVADITGHIQRLRDEDEFIRMGIGVRVQPYGEASPDVGAERELLRSLMKRREDYLRQRRELETLGEELQSLEVRKDALPREHERLQEESRVLATDTESLQTRLAELKARRESRYGVLDPEGEQRALEDELSRLTREEGVLSDELAMLRITLDEEQAELPHCVEEAGRMQTAVEEAEAGLRDHMRVVGFIELVELRTKLAVLDDSQDILDRVAAAEKELEKARSKAAETHTAVRALSLESTVQEPLEAVLAAIAEGEKLCETLRAKKDEEELTLREYRDAEHERREILTAIAVQEKVYDETVAEQKLLRMRDAAETQRKRQRLMLNRLIEQTNLHLALLSGRYLLRSIEEDGFGIEVEDSQQGRTHRSVKTLSGGESFLVSLCLALGLSEMAARHRKIESLFLDEGFGALDDEMLYKVMAALKGLRANGKMVGVISHVKRLADEIPTQIRLDKVPDGSSRITVVA